MSDIRAGILAVTICLIIFAIANQPRPVKSTKVDYCKVGSQFWLCAGLKYRLNI